MKTFAVHIVSALVLTSTTFAAQAQPQSTPCVKESDGIEAAAKQHDADFQSITDEGKSIEGDKGKATIGGTIDLKMVEQKWVLDVPQLKVKMNRAFFDVPTATMSTQRIVYDTIVTTMVPTKTGQYPETVVESCLVDGPFGSKFSSVCTTIRWHDIITNVPQFTKISNEIKLDIPQFSSTKWSLDIPNVETTMVQQTWLVKLPQITVRDFTVESRKLKDRGDDLEKRATKVQQQQRGDVNKATAVFYSCQASSLREQKIAIQAQYLDGIAKLDQAIAQIRAYGIDPTQVRTSDGATVNMIAQKEKLVEDWHQNSAEIDAQANKLEEDGKKMTTQT